MFSWQLAARAKLSVHDFRVFGYFMYPELPCNLRRSSDPRHLSLTQTAPTGNGPDRPGVGRSCEDKSMPGAKDGAPWTPLDFRVNKFPPKTRIRIQIFYCIALQMYVNLPGQCARTCWEFGNSSYDATKLMMTTTTVANICIYIYIYIYIYILQRQQNYGV